MKTVLNITMSTQTGIVPNSKLSKVLSQCGKGQLRLIKVVIRQEELDLDLYFPPKGDWKQDWDRMVPTAIEDRQPSYLLYRSKNLKLYLNNMMILIHILVI